MNFEREQRKLQLEKMAKTVTGRQRVVMAYERIGLPRGSTLLAPPPPDQMIEAILNAQFPKEFERTIARSHR